MKKIGLFGCKKSQNSDILFSFSSLRMLDSDWRCNADSHINSYSSKRQSSFQFITEDSQSITFSLWFIDKGLIFAPDDTGSTFKLVLNIATVIEHLIILVTNLDFSSDLSGRLNKNLVKSLAVFKLQMELFRKLTD